MKGLLQLPTATDERLPDDVAREVITTARHIVARLQRRNVIRKAEVDDLVGDLVLQAVRCWPNYLASKASATTYLTFVMRRAAITLLRARQAQKRGYGQCVSLNDAGDCNGQPLDSHSCMAVYPNHVDAIDLRLDTEAVQAQLSDELRALCALLMIMTQHEAARQLRVSRYVVAAWMCEIRHCFELAGVDVYR